MMQNLTFFVYCSMTNSGQHDFPKYASERRTSPERILRRNSHSVCLVEYDQFEARRKYLARRGEVFDLFSHYVNASIVRCIQFHDLVLVFVSEYFASDRQDQRRLSRSRRPVE